MAGQKQVRRSKRSEEEEIADLPRASDRDEASQAELDDLLDEIDGILETNAEELVKGYVQKGGQ